MLVEFKIKGQVSVEFAGIIAMIMLIVLSVQLYFYYLSQQAFAIQNSHNARVVADNILNYLSIASITNGYNSSFVIPSISGLQSVNVSLKPSLLVVSVGNSTVSYPFTGIVELNSSGVLISPPFYLSSGFHVVSSVNGVVVIG
jgi:uncharacterized protein (UPF0333 family)